MQLLQKPHAPLLPLLLLQVMGEDVDQETLTRILLAVMAAEPGRGEAELDEQAAQQLAALKPAGAREGDVGKAQAAAAFIMRRFGKSAAKAAAETLQQVRWCGAGWGADGGRSVGAFIIRLSNVNTALLRSVDASAVPQD